MVPNMWREGKETHVLQVVQNKLCVSHKKGRWFPVAGNEPLRVNPQNTPEKLSFPKDEI